MVALAFESSFTCRRSKDDPLRGGVSAPAVKADTGVPAVLRRMPEWMRRDLSSPNDRNRRRAEEALAAMIGAATGESAKGIDPAS
jgi:hypothetical protein